MTELTEEKNVAVHPTPQPQAPANPGRSSSDSSIAEHAGVNEKALLRKLDERG